MRLFNLLLLITVVFTLLSCPITRYEKEEIDDPPPFTEASLLFESEELANGRTLTIFRTNDLQYWTHEGMTLWSVFGHGEDPFTSRSVTVAKSSGSTLGGYGIVFCHGIHEIEIEDEENIFVPAMFVVMINNDGYFITGKAVGGVFNDFGWWRTSNLLRKGDGTENEITVTYDETEEEFSLYFNGQFQESFKDDGMPVLTGGRNGYIAVITPFDNFPAVGIDVYFEEEK